MAQRWSLGWPPPSLPRATPPSMRRRRWPASFQVARPFERNVRKDRESWSASGRSRVAQQCDIASYSVNEQAVARARRLIESRQYVLDSDWGDVQPTAADENAFLESHSWDEYAEWHLGLTEGAADETKARYAFVYGDFRRVHRDGLIACVYRASEWRHKDVELAAHDLLQLLDRVSG